MNNLHLYTLLEMKRFVEHVDENCEDSGDAFMAVKKWVDSRIEKVKQFYIDVEEREA